MKVVTAEQMRRIDEITIKERGILGATLMDRAGRAVAREALERFEPNAVAVVTGKGNNAGDGFVAARELARHGTTVTVFMLRQAGELRGDALGAYESMPEELPRVVEPTPEALEAELGRYDLVIDAIFGTGLSGPVREPWDAYIGAINRAEVDVLSVDIPSGLPGDVGAEIGAHVRATVTVTMGLPKITMVLGEGLRATGQVSVADIGFPEDLTRDSGLQVNLMTMAEASGLLPDRRANGHKGTFGRVMILGGSAGMTGAAVLAARAAARSGAGLIYVAYPEPLSPIIEGHLIEPVKIPLAGEHPWFCPHHVEEVLERAVEMDAVALGPGIGTRPETGQFVRAIIERIETPLVIDADGLNLIAIDRLDLARRHGHTVLTPHPGEAARLLGRSIEDLMADRLNAFVEHSRRTHSIVLLKGAQSIVTDWNGERWINPSGNTGLAKGGSGDVLTGLVAGLLAQGCAPMEAAGLGAFVHGMAADILAERMSVRAMLPGDLIETLGETYRRLERTPPESIATARPHLPE